MRKTRIGAALLLLGLLVELASLHWGHPLSFVVFFVVGGAAMGAGVLVYLHSLLWKGPPAENRPS